MQMVALEDRWVAVVERLVVLMERLVRKKTSFDVKVAYEVGLGYLEALDEVRPCHEHTSPPAPHAKP